MYLYSCWSHFEHRPCSFRFSFLILHRVCRTPWTGDQLAARPIPTHRINVDKHSFLDWHSNQRSQRSSGRRHFMFYTARHFDRHRMIRCLANMKQKLEW
jgi:hypothetical protein